MYAGLFDAAFLRTVMTEHHGIAVSYNLCPADAAGGRGCGEGTGPRPLPAPARTPSAGGMLVHLDASTHEWIAGLPMQDLVVALDDADGRILYAQFVAQEGTLSTFQALELNRARLRPLL